MCQTIIINKGEIEIETPKDFKSHFGFKPIKAEHYNNVDEDCCLCQVDIEKSLFDNDIKFELSECGNIIINQT